MSSQKNRARARGRNLTQSSGPLNKKALRAALGKVKMLLMDVDGTLTDGSITMLEDGNRTAQFSVRDGYGLMLLRYHGIKLGFITGSNHWYIDERAKSLKVDYVVKNTLAKVAAFQKILKSSGLRAEEVAYIGDDFPDAELFPYVGVGVAVSDAMPSVKARAHAITRNPGGHGAVRELVEWIREAQGIPEVVEKSKLALLELPAATNAQTI